jgi:vacuolar-type H+-ATPase subunit B/Vma2
MGDLLLKVNFFTLYELVTEIRSFHRVAKDLPLEIIEKEIKHFEKAFEDHFEYAKKVIDYFETTGVYIELLKRLIEEKKKAKKEEKGVCDE